MRFGMESICEVPSSRALFGRSEVFPLRRRSRGLDLLGGGVELRRQLRAACPKLPGVYAFLDRSGHVIYVGLSSKLRNRLLTYFHGGAADRKEHAISGQAEQLKWQVIDHEFAAQVRELELIRRFQPRLNVRGRLPGRPLSYIYVSSESAPRLCVARRLPKGIRHSWGPVSLGGRLRAAVESANRVFKLRDCPTSVPKHIADQRQLF